MYADVVPINSAKMGSPILATVDISHDPSSLKSQTGPHLEMRYGAAVLAAMTAAAIEIFEKKRMKLNMVGGRSLRLVVVGSPDPDSGEMHEMQSVKYET